MNISLDISEPAQIPFISTEAVVFSFRQGKRAHNFQTVWPSVGPTRCWRADGGLVLLCKQPLSAG